jgi:thiamine biosynthesis lipoprotein
MSARGVDHYLLHGGQSSVLARGSRGRSSPADHGWWIGVRDPLRPTRRLAEVRVLNRALATSGAAVQFFIHEGRRYGHLLDPRTGRPAESSLSATILAPTAAEADAISTACYVLGKQGALDYCSTRPEIGLIHFSPSAQAGSFEVVTIGIAEDDIRWLEPLP